MKILSIDTSCDDTSVAIADGLNILSNVFWSKLKVHQKWGGVVPLEAKRQHQEFLNPAIQEALEQANVILNSKTTQESKLVSLNDIDYFAVTYGPGLAIALEAGINKSRELSKKHNKPLIAVNHMSGHIYSVLARDKNGSPLSNLDHFEFPLIALTISGGHTELVLINDHMDFKVIGQTVDDASGEAFDKVGRLLGFGFPAGKYIEEASLKGDKYSYKFPRPMLNTDTLNFSFSGLKTAVLYEVKKITGEYSSDQVKGKLKLKDDSNKLTEAQINNIAASFQEAIIDCLISKSAQAIKKYDPKMFVVGGGVIANKTLRERMTNMCSELGIKLYYPLPTWLCTDNAAMIATAAYFMIEKKKNIYMPIDIDLIDRNPSLELS